MLLKNSNKVLKYNGSLLNINEYDPYNPLNLPPYTIRVRTLYGDEPSGSLSRFSITRLDSNTFDVTCTSYQDNWSNLFHDSDENPSKITDVLGANTTNVKNMYGMFWGCQALSSLSIFDTRGVIHMTRAFVICNNLSSVPNYDMRNVKDLAQAFGSTNLKETPILNTSGITAFNQCFYVMPSLQIINDWDYSNATNVDYMFSNCQNVSAGISSTYYNMLNNATNLTSHVNTFLKCGTNTEQGRAELALIPQSWGGTGA